MRLVCVAALLLGTACTSRPPVVPAADVASPYAQRMVFAVAPLRNESGSRFADGTLMADRLVQRLDQVQGIATVPVNRVLAAMNELGIDEIRTVDQAMAIRGVLRVDALIAGTVTAYDPYDPPKLGVALDLFVDPEHRSMLDGFNARQVTWAAVDGMSRPLARSAVHTTQPVAAAAGHFDAESRRVMDELRSYALGQGLASEDRLADELTRIDMDRYARFVSHALIAQLMQAERDRLSHPTLGTARRHP